MWSLLDRKRKSDAPARALTIADLRPGQTARVGCLDCPQVQRCARLAAFGLVQGQTITLLQRAPAFVIRVDETELALDEEVARCVQVHPPL